MVICGGQIKTELSREFLEDKVSQYAGYYDRRRGVQSVYNMCPNDVVVSKSGHINFTLHRGVRKTLYGMHDVWVNVNTFNYHVDEIAQAEVIGFPGEVQHIYIEKNLDDDQKKVVEAIIAHTLLEITQHNENGYTGIEVIPYDKLTEAGIENNFIEPENL